MAPNEFELIEHLTRALTTGQRTLVGPGDDCAVLKGTSGSDLLVTCDMLVEGVHFRRDTIGWNALGAKALTCGLSDVAAMGGTPRWATVSLGLPPGFDEREALALYDGLADQARRFQVDIVGGDTVATHDGVVLDVTVIGDVPVGLAFLRRAAQPGDAIVVTGTLGDAAGGLDVLLHGDPSAAETRRLVAAHQAPTPRLDVAQHLIASHLVRACIDLSDGLAGDLKHVCEASGVSAVVFEEAIPMSPAMRAYAKPRGVDPLAWALGGGEDYELAFTLPEAVARRLIGDWNLRGSVGMTIVGAIEDGPPAVKLRRSGGVTEPMPYGGYDHFAERT